MAENWKSSINIKCEACTSKLLKKTGENYNSFEIVYIWNLSYYFGLYETENTQLQIWCPENYM